MEKTRSILMFAVTCAFSLTCAAQILPAARVEDPSSRLLQKRYSPQLQQIAADAMSIHFPYHFYFNQMLDVDESRQKELPQGSVHFDRFNEQAVLEITGNYYAAYSAAALNANQRARQTFQDVVLPLLKVEVARVDRTIPFGAYAFEIAHHVRTKVMGIDTENPENLTLVFPRSIAERLVQAKDVEDQQAAVLDSEVYLNSEPLALWLVGDDAPADVKDHYLAEYKPTAEPDLAQSRRHAQSISEPAAKPEDLVNPRLLGQPRFPARTLSRSTQEDVSPGRMVKLQTTYQNTLEHLVHDLNQQAGFVAYAPPVFVPFHQGAYLQLSISTDLAPAAGASQYRIAALAFDQHVSHLLRPVFKYFHDGPQFEGIDFSTTVHQEVQPNTESVEFVVPFSALMCYDKFDCSGQELINRSIVLVNGERVTLDLQRAESDYNASLR